MAPYSSTLAWKIPWMEEPGRLQSMGSHRVRHEWSNLAAAAAYTPVFVAWRIPGTGEPGGLPSMGSHRVRHNWRNLAAAAAKKKESEVALLCPTLCSPMNSSSPFTVHEIFQARILEWVAIPFSRGSSQHIISCFVPWLGGTWSQNYFWNNTKSLFAFFSHCSDIFTDGTKAVVGKIVGMLAWIKALNC